MIYIGDEACPIPETSDEGRPHHPFRGRCSRQCAGEVCLAAVYNFTTADNRDPLHKKTRLGSGLPNV
jgi:hypothetical protein